MAKYDIGLPAQYDNEKEMITTPPKQTRGTLANIGKGLVDGTVKGVAQIKLGGSATAESLYNSVTGSSDYYWTKKSSKELQELQEQIDLTSPDKPFSYQLSSGLGEYVPVVGGAVATGGTAGLVVGAGLAAGVGGGREYQDLTTKGVDHSTAMTSSAIASGKEAALAVMPVANFTKIAKGAKVDAAISIGAPVVSYQGGTYVQGKYLESKGYSKEAKVRLEEATSPTAIALNTLLAGGLHFGVKAIESRSLTKAYGQPTPEATPTSILGDTQATQSGSFVSPDTPVDDLLKAAATSDTGGIRVSSGEGKYTQAQATPTTAKADYVGDKPFEQQTTYESPYEGVEVQLNPEQLKVFEEFNKSGAPRTQENLEKLYSDILDNRNKEQIFQDNKYLSNLEADEAWRRVHEYDDPKASKSLDDEVTEELDRILIKSSPYELNSYGDLAAYETKLNNEISDLYYGESLDSNIDVPLTTKDNKQLRETMEKIVKGERVTIDYQLPEYTLRRGRGADYYAKYNIGETSSKDFVPNDTLKDLPIKSGESMAGGQIKGHTRDFAIATYTKHEKDIKYFSSFNDKFHKGKGGRHPKGEAFDIVLETKGLDTKQIKEKAASTTKMLQDLSKELGFSVKLLDEYNYPSKNSTGGHIHISVTGRGTVAKMTLDQADKIDQGVVKVNGKEYTASGKYQYTNSTPTLNTVYAKSRDYGISHDDALVAQAIAKQESSGNVNSINQSDGSTAKGLFQFTDKAWYALGGTDANRFDIDTNVRLFIKHKGLVTERIKRDTGYVLKDSEFIYPHMLGEAGAKHALNTLKRDPKTPMREVLKKHHSDKTIDGIFKNNNINPNSNVSEFLSVIRGRIDSKLVVVPSSARVTSAATTHVVEDMTSPVEVRGKMVADDTTPSIPVSKTTPEQYQQYLSNIDSVKMQDLIDMYKPTDHVSPAIARRESINTILHREQPISTGELRSAPTPSNRVTTAPLREEATIAPRGSTERVDAFKRGEDPTQVVIQQDAPPTRSIKDTERGVVEVELPNKVGSYRVSNKDIVPTVRQAVDDIPFIKSEKGSYQFRKTKDGVTEVVMKDGTLVRHKDGVPSTVTHKDTTWKLRDTEQLREAIKNLTKRESVGDSAKGSNTVFQALDALDQTKTISMNGKEMLPSEWKKQLQQEQETLRVISKVADDVFLCSINF